MSSAQTVQSLRLVVNGYYSRVSIFELSFSTQQRHLKSSVISERSQAPRIEPMANIGFIGAGNICNALVTGFIASGVKPEHLFVSAPSNRNLHRFTELGCSVTNDNTDLFPGNRYNCTIIFLCVKPTILKPFSKSNPFLVFKGDNSLILVSTLAGTTLNRLREVIVCQSLSGDECRSLYIYRAMPNTACSVRQGFFGICRTDNNESVDATVYSLLSKLGLCEFVEEKQLNAITGVAGSGIAFVYSLIQAMADGGVKMGLQRDLALRCAVQTFLGSTTMVSTTKKHPIALRDDVCSAGGTTIHGIHALEKAAVSGAIIDAIEAATKRAEQLSLD